MNEKVNEYMHEEQIAELKAELSALEEKLATPARTVEDIVRHIQLLKELSGC